jgi:hypothetical protein
MPIRGVMIEFEESDVFRCGSRKKIKTLPDLVFGLSYKARDLDHQEQKKTK